MTCAICPNYGFCSFSANYKNTDTLICYERGFVPQYIFDNKHNAK